jgi:hypothetical protein
MGQDVGPARETGLYQVDHLLAPLGNCILAGFHLDKDLPSCAGLQEGITD